MLVSLSSSIIPVLAVAPSNYFLLEQSGDSYIVEAIQEDMSASEFYDYRSASGHNDFFVPFVSKIYLYQDSGEDGQLSLIVHHNKDNEGLHRFLQQDLHKQILFQ